jgi:uncharacterized protein YjbJ (UPF0337 family)
LNGLEGKTIEVKGEIKEYRGTLLDNIKKFPSTPKGLIVRAV